MKLAVAMIAGAFALMPLASVQAADVLAQTVANPKPAARATPQPAPSVPNPVIWALLAIGGVGLIGAAARRRPEPRIRITFD